MMTIALALIAAAAAAPALNTPEGDGYVLLQSVVNGGIEVETFKFPPGDTRIRREFAQVGIEVGTLGHLGGDVYFGVFGGVYGVFATPGRATMDADYLWVSDDFRQSSGLREVVGFVINPPKAPTFRLGVLAEQLHSPIPDTWYTDPAGQWFCAENAPWRNGLGGVFSVDFAVPGTPVGVLLGAYLLERATNHDGLYWHTTGGGKVYFEDDSPFVKTTLVRGSFAPDGGLTAGLKVAF